ncbi:hypothetical protein [Myxosarcina sp. GI1]|uniref:hypothetical protein n=1 Tax=Myxosarcina sp. GI1 TaxID=1541065 RepID=UPI00055E2D28|nr:hypothetical protein [Myxosarcina sp. GI1]
MDLLIIGFLGASVVICLAAQNWRLSVKTALVIVVIEGALRKWGLPQASQLIYFLKDFILIGAYLSYFFAGSRSNHHFAVKNRTIEGFVYITTIWCLFQAFNPALGSPIIGFFGIRNYLIYVPLMWMLPSLFASEEELYKYLRAYLLLLIPVGLLAIAQYFSPPSSPLNVYAADMEQEIALSGGAVRVTGTFSYIGGYTTYLMTCLCLLIPMISRRQTRLWEWLTIIEIMLIAITSLMTGSRALIILSILLLAGYFYLEASKNITDLINSFKKFLVPAIAAFAVVTIKFATAVNTFEARAAKSDDIVPRIINIFTEPFRFMGLTPYGYGSGATFQANAVIRSLLHLPQGQAIRVYYEAEPGRVTLELGMVGFVLWYGLKIVLLVAMWRVCQKLNRPFLRRLGYSILVFLVINSIGQIVFNHVTNLYYWFLNGFIFLLPHLERIEIWKHNYYVAQYCDRTEANFTDPSHQ